MQCIPNKSDFKIKVQLKDFTGTIVHPLDFEWDLIWYTLSDVPFTASHRFGEGLPDQHILLPNTVIIDEQIIEVRVDGFDFCKKGPLKFISKMHFANSDFKDDIQTVPSPELTLNIMIV